MCSGEAFATPDEFDQYFSFDLCESELADIKPVLQNSAQPIYMAMQASGACNCTLSPFATGYLKDLNMLIAAVRFNFTTARLSDEQRTIYNEYAQEQLTLIRNGDIELCAGETGKTYPTFAIAQQSWTTRNAAKIIVNRDKANNG